MKVSIILPVYNVEKYIRRCIESLIHQTHRDLEIIFVNDATPDNSMQIVQEYADKDDRIIFVNNSRNMGPMMSRENGYRIATGDFIMFADSDDYMPLDAVEILLKEIIVTDADIVSGGYIYKRNDGIEETHTFTLPYGNDPKAVYHALLEEKFVHALWGKIYNSRLFLDYEYITFDKATNGEDACLFYQIVQNTKNIVTIENIVYYYAQNAGSATQIKLSLKRIEDILKGNTIRLKIISEYPSLSDLLDHFLTIVMTGMYLNGHADKEVSNLIEKYGFSQYVSIRHALTTLTLKEQMQWLKAYLLSKLDK